MDPLVPKIALALAGIAVAAGAGLAAARLLARRQGPAADRLYPYLVPEPYLEHAGGAPEGLFRPLGHGIWVTLVFDMQGLVQGVTADDLRRLKSTPEQAHARALRNLEKLAAERQVEMRAFPKGPSGGPFVLVGGHWAAATSILLPRLRDLVAGPLGTRDVCASIPHREALLLFPRGDRAHRDAMRALVWEKESDGRKPLTFELFMLGDGGVKPFDEHG